MQHTPSSFIAEMGLTTEERLARINEVYPPRIVELIDIGATSAQKVRHIYIIHWQQCVSVCLSVE